MRVGSLAQFVGTVVVAGAAAIPLHIAAAADAPAGGSGPYQVARSIHLGGPGTWPIEGGERPSGLARTMALDASTHRIYLPTAEFAEGGGRRPQTKPESFMLVVVAREQK